MGTLFAKSPVSNEMKKVNPFMTAKGFKEGTYFKTKFVGASSGVTFKVSSRLRITLTCAFYEIYNLNENDYFVCSEEPVRYISGNLKIGVFYNYGTFHEIGESVSLGTDGTLNFYLKVSSQRDIKEGSILILQDNQNKYYLVCWYSNIRQQLEKSISANVSGFDTVSGLVMYTQTDGSFLNLDTNYLPVGNKTFLKLSYPVFTINRYRISAYYNSTVGLNIK